jgi:uncharacterized protein (DUF1501 family)
MEEDAMQVRPCPMDFDRRSFVLGMGALGFGLASPGARAARARERRDGHEGPRLVVLQLSGGNDGLSTVVPYADDSYHAARRNLRLAPQDCLTIDDYRALHPNLARLHRRYQDGKLAIVEGVGYPHPNRSHFKSMEIWHTANLRGRAAGEGWLGRACSRALRERVDPNLLVHLGSEAPWSVVSSAYPAAVFALPEAYRWVGEEGDLARIAEGESAAGVFESLAFLRESMSAARTSSASVRSAVARYRTPVEYPTGTFGDALRCAAALIENVGTRVVSLELGGFDTHNDQPDRLASTLRTLDEGLDPFLTDLERSAAGRSTLVLVFSEFGRRVAENGSRGTDHGTAGPVLFAGAPVKGGLYGKHPSLAELDDGDLVHTTDFRSVYASALRHTFEIDPARVLGERFEPLPVA